MAPRAGRPSAPLDPDASSAAYLGAELRRRRQARGWTLDALAQRVDYSLQHISEVERAKAAPSASFIEACDRMLDARGRLLDLLPAVEHERAKQRVERAVARREHMSTPLRCEPTDSEAGDVEDVEPTTRRGLLDAGAGAALGALGAAASTAAPAAAREVDPELPAHSADLLRLLGRHDATFGPHEVLHIVQRELHRIARTGRVARGELRVELLRVEAHWAEFGAFLSNDAGRARDRDALAERALWLAREADCPDLVACVRMRQGQWAVQRHDARRAVVLAEAALSVPNTRASSRALCALRAAVSHALAKDAPSCERRLADANNLAAADPSATSWSGAATPALARSLEARCWSLLEPRKAIPLYERALRDWPRHCVRDGGLHQIHLAKACAAAGELDRAKAEGRKALGIARMTKSVMAVRELRELRETLAAA